MFGLGTGKRRRVLIVHIPTVANLIISVSINLQPARMSSQEALRSVEGNSLYGARVMESLKFNRLYILSVGRSKRTELESYKLEI